MPALGESVTEGTVTRWLKKVGDAVAADEALLEVSTDKVDTEIPSPVSGTVLSIDVPVDSTVAVGARLASIGVSGSTAPATKPTPVAPVATPAPTQYQRLHLLHLLLCQRQLLLLLQLQLRRLAHLAQMMRM